MPNFFFARFRLIEVCERNVLCGFRAHSSIPKSEVDPLATRGLCSAAVHDVSLIFLCRS